jgi:curli production assembly/transport component CsgG/holdfast attachment protein HfaB
MSGFTRGRPVKIAVGQISDYTGKTESDGSGRKVTAGAALMAMAALAKAGVPMVERFDTSVAEMELKYANNKLITDDMPRQAGDYRKIMSGSIPGSDFYIVGGITELNFNLRSENVSGNGGGTGTAATKGVFGGSLYVMNIAMDLRLVNSVTLEVVDVVSLQKQIIGRQVSAGVFSFLGTNFFDASMGESALEPVQLAVRAVIERSVMEMGSRAYGANTGACAVAVDYLGGNSYGGNPYQQQAMAYQPYGAPQQAFGYQQPYAYQQPAYQQQPAAFNRANTYRGYSDPDPMANSYIRPGY